jgi:competence protein ComEC
VTSVDKAGIAFISIFLTGALWPNLPHVSLIILAIVAISFLLLYSLSAFAVGALLGFFWVTLTGNWYLHWQIDSSVFHQNVIVEGTIISIGQGADNAAVLNTVDDAPESSRQVRFNMRLDKIGKYSTFRSPDVRLSWFQPEVFPQQGQRYRLLVNLKPPGGLANPHSFHYQTWLASKNIVATGYVLKSPTNEILQNTVTLRQRSIDRLAKLSLEQSSWLQALTFGYRGGLTDADWSLLQTSGTAHLFAISGLHLSIVCGYCLFVLRRPIALAVSFTKVGQVHIAKISLVFAFLLCLLYAYLAGYQVPVLRALLALALWTYLSLSNSHWRLSSVCIALLVTFFILFPYAILGVSFWFSFLAVISIWCFVWRFGVPKTISFWSGVRYTCYLQIWLSVITAPMTFYIFGQLPIFALIANLLLVPWVSFVLVPLCLLGSFMMLLGLPYALLFEIAAKAMEVALYVMLQTQNLSDDLAFWLSQWGSGWNEIKGLNAIQMAFVLIIILLCLLPFWPQRPLLLVLLSSGFIASIALPHRTNTELLVFDVGQGSAALLQHQGKYWLFDTGGAYPSGFSMAESVLLPYLRHEGITRLDKVILSHLDNDHAGGMQTLAQHLQISKVLSPAQDCVAPNKFRLEGLEASTLWPMESRSGHENNHSCVILLDINGHKVLFTGDIERSAETAIIESGKALKANILIAPHHGSLTSSSKQFVQAVRPKYVVFSAGAGNRWSFPNPKVVQRYVDIGSIPLQTGKQGAIAFSFDQQEISVTTYREDMYNRWYYKSSD